MILIDTSVWVNHFRKPDVVVNRLLSRRQVRVHPLVIGELACGSMRRRSEVLAALKELPGANVAEQDEVLLAIDRHHFWGKGIGLIEVHLIVSALLWGYKIWTADMRLHREAARLGVAAGPPIQ